jgi:hypothetical protein
VLWNTVTTSSVFITLNNLCLIALMILLPIGKNKQRRGDGERREKYSLPHFHFVWEEEKPSSVDVLVEEIRFFPKRQYMGSFLIFGWGNSGPAYNVTFRLECLKGIFGIYWEIMSIHFKTIQNIFSYQHRIKLKTITRWKWKALNNRTVSKANLNNPWIK